MDKSNLTGDQRYSDRLTYDGTWENNLFNFIRMVIPKLTRDLPHPFTMNGVIRTDDTLAEETNLSIAPLRREIGILRKEGYLSREGNNKNGQWIILKKGKYEQG